MNPNRNDAQAVSIAELCDEFKSNWLSSMQPVEKFLLNHDVSRFDDSILIHLIRSEIELSHRAGKIPSRDDYSRRFPDLDDEVLDNLMFVAALPPVRMGSKKVPYLPGRYKVIEQIGQGGIGSVWRVEDREMKRPLAAKVLLDRFKDSAAANVRLEREALLSGSLQHPGIPPVFELGDLLTGSKFFTMKLVEGKTLDELLTARQDHADARQHMLGVFRQIAEAVGFAHSRDVIHRDLKPANIMVGEFGEVQIMDWGMAKQLGDTESNGTGDNSIRKDRPESNQSSAQETQVASIDSSMVQPSLDCNTDSPNLTMAGDVIGTPNYMSPEQAQGNQEQLNEKTDVFSLGAILFEILTGRVLYSGIAREHSVEAASNCDLSKSFVALNDCAADTELLDICRQCLEKEPSRRPADGRQVARAIAEYLDGVDKRLRQAEVDRSWAEVRALEEKKRRQTFVRMAWCVGLIGLIGALGIGWKWSEADQNLKEASRQNAAREVYFSKSLEAIDKMLTRVGYETLANVPGMGELRKELLEEALTFYDEFVALAGKNERLDDELAKVLKLMGHTHSLMGDNPKSEEAYQKAIELLSNLVREGSNTEARKLELASCRSSLGKSLYEMGRIESAAEQLELALPALEQGANEYAVDDATSSQLEHYARWMIALANARSINATIQYSSSGKDASIKELKLAQNAFEAIPIEYSNNRVQVEHALCLAQLGRHLEAVKQINQANELSALAIEIIEGVVKRNPDSPAFRNTQINLLQAMNSRMANNGFYEQAVVGFAQQLEIQNKLVNDFPNLPQLKSQLVRTYALLGSAKNSLGRNEQALELLEKGIELGEQLVKDFPHTISHLNELSYIYRSTAICRRQSRDPVQREKSATENERSYELSKQIVEISPEDPDYQFRLAVAAQTFSDSVYQLKDISEPEAKAKSLELMLESESILKSLLSNSPDDTNYQYRLAFGWTNRSREISSEDPLGAADLLQQAADGFKRLIEQLPDDPQFRFQLVRALDARAMLYFKLGQKTKCESQLKAAYESMQQTVDKFGINARTTEFVTISQNRLGHVSKTIGNVDAAEELFKAALKSRIEFFDRDPENRNLKRKVASANANLAWLYSFWQDHENPQLDLAVQHAKTAVDYDPDASDNWTCLAYIHFLRGERQAFNTALDKIDPDDEFDQMTRAAIQAIDYHANDATELAEEKLAIAKKLAASPNVVEYWAARLTRPEGLELVNRADLLINPTNSPKR